jgi:hypothetical protein
VRGIYYWLERGDADFEAEVDSEYAEFCQVVRKAEADPR